MEKLLDLLKVDEETLPRLPQTLLEEAMDEARLSIVEKANVYKSLPRTGTDYVCLLREQEERAREPWRRELLAAQSFLARARSATSTSTAKDAITKKFEDKAKSHLLADWEVFVLEGLLSSPLMLAHLLLEVPDQTARVRIANWKFACEQDESWLQLNGAAVARLSLPLFNDPQLRALNELVFEEERGSAVATGGGQSVFKRSGVVEGGGMAAIFSGDGRQQFALDTTALEAQLKTMQREIREMRSGGPKKSGRQTCYRCHKEGHIAKNCFEATKNEPKNE